MDDLEKFLKFLYENDTGYVYSPLKKKTGEWEERFFQWPSQSQALYDWIITSSDSGNVYLAPAIYNKKEAKKESISHTNVAWVEFDGQSSIDFKSIPRPDVIVQTSVETHLHCYWKIPQAKSLTVEDVNRRLTYFLSADSSGWDATQLLRPPLTKNWKSNLPVKIKEYSTPLFKHKLESFDSAPNVERPPLQVEYDDILEPTELLNQLKLPRDLEVMVTKEVAHEPHRSTFLMRAGYLLAAANLSELEIVSLLYVIDVRIKKFVGRSDQLLRLSEIAAIASLDAQKQLNIEGYSPLEILNNKETLEWVIDGWLHRNGIMLITGAPGVGKTQFAFDIAYRLATGGQVVNKPAVAPMTVAFLSLEMEIVELKYIIEHQIKAWDKDTLPLYDANFKAYAPDDERSFAAYERILATHKPKVLIIDSLSELSTDELKEAEARVIMSWVRKIRKDYDCAIILIHHNRKASDSNKKPRKLSDLYGSYIFGKLSETVISLWDLEKNDELEIDSFKVRFGTKAPVRIKRSEHLTFSRIEVTVNVNTKSGRTGFANPLVEGLFSGNSD